MVSSKKYCPSWVYDCVVAQAVTEFILYGVDLIQPCRKFSLGLSVNFRWGQQPDLICPNQWHLCKARPNHDCSLTLNIIFFYPEASIVEGNEAVANSKDSSASYMFHSLFSTSDIRNGWRWNPLPGKECWSKGVCFRQRCFFKQRSIQKQIWKFRGLVPRNR